MEEKILILDFGSQYTQLIARRIRELNIYCEIYPYNNPPNTEKKYMGLILSGSPFSVHDNKAPIIDLNDYKGIPVLGICYGAQMVASKNGCTVLKSKIREYGRAKLTYIDHKNSIMEGVKIDSDVWMSHGDSINNNTDKLDVIASTDDVEVASYAIKELNFYGLQFHPEVTHSQEGKKVIENFALKICGCSQSWTPDLFIEQTVNDLRGKLGSDKVILGLSGGVDSSVAAFIINKAIGKNLFCVFVDNGLLRKNEFKQVLNSYKDLGLNVIGVDSKDLFYQDLKGKIDPEDKRKSIGKNFIKIFEEEAKKIGDISWLAQGTIYPDVIESISVKGPSATIKSHHNVGGLPEKMNLKVVEPLNLLFKDEVRKVGRSLDIPDSILERHPFPGPGLGIRILGEVNREKVDLLQNADDIFISSLIESGLYNEVWQAATILLPVKSVGVMGDERTYEYTVVLRAVTSLDGMTADWSRLPDEFLAEVSNKIINRVRGINRVVYDISSKPPATIEWE
ncbi:MAG: glutamine-hydrolyzing GMP synthase [Marinoscillum sp.]|nr:glutamine-hydrolyzing GMP synthase [Marinoscillum sp.]OUX26586.1 MAG: GMP synthase (glutamine-hydrolyzing) [Flammeovirgaceae bacterium TMED262]